MANYAPNLPRDKGDVPMQEFSTPIKAKTTWRATLLASSVISLSDNTTAVEIGTIGGNGVVFRWVPASETAGVSPFASVISSGLGVANWDHFVAADTVRRFVVPVSTNPAGSIVGANTANGLFPRLAWAAAILSSSVMATEF